MCVHFREILHCVRTLCTLLTLAHYSNLFMKVLFCSIENTHHLVQLQREINESLNLTFTSSCNKGIVSCSFWTSQVHAAQMLRKIKNWTNPVPRRELELKLYNSPTRVLSAAGNVPLRRAVMAIHIPSISLRNVRKFLDLFCPRMRSCS